MKLIESDREAITIGERAGIAPKIGHEKAVGLVNEGKTGEIIRLVEEARARGLNAVTDQYPYDGAATALLRELIVVPKAIEETPGFDLTAALRDPVKRAALSVS